MLMANRLDREGIEPRETDGLLGIVFAPLLHGGWGHLIANTFPALVLGFLILLSGLRTWVGVTLVVWVIGGFGTWLTGGDNSVHIGASGLIFRSEEHTSELQSLMRISYAVFCLK